MCSAAKKHVLRAIAIVMWLTLAACGASPAAEGIVAADQDFNAGSRPAELLGTNSDLKVAFIYNGDATKARGYFKTISGEIIDEFDITAGGAAAPTALQ
jgi:hypothetical protein